jgi:hypothetical protein
MAAITAGDRVVIVGDHPHSGREGHWTGKIQKMAEDMYHIKFDDHGGPRIGGSGGCYATAEHIQIRKRTDLGLEDFGND